MSRALVLALAVLVSGACRGHTAAPESPTDLVVVSTGMLPQRPLRYAAPKGTKTTLELAIDGRIEAGEIKSASPGLVFTLELAVDDVLPDGTMKTSTTITDLTTRASGEDPGAQRALDQAAQLKGMRITATLSPDGRIADVQPAVGERKLSETASAQLAQLAQAFPQLAMPLPTAPVGVGAKWRSSRTFTPNPTLSLTAVTTVDLVTIQGSMLTFAMTSEVQGADQTVMQDGVAVEVRNISGTAAGKGTIDLGKLALVGTISAELRMEMTTGNDRTPMMMAMTIATAQP